MEHRIDQRPRQETVHMRLLQAPRQLRHASSSDDAARPEIIELSAHRGSAQRSPRHDARLPITRTASAADPYAAWLQQRESEREREARQLNPRAAWDDLRLQGFCVIGR
jgi:hypothetical protein